MSVDAYGTSRADRTGLAEKRSIAKSGRRGAAGYGPTLSACVLQANPGITLIEDMKKPSTYVTQRHVAQRAGVHQTTVSLVLRNHPSVPAATRERVLGVI